MKKMQKRWGALTMAAVMLFCTVFVLVSDMSPVYADGELTLKLHYHREDGNYDGWDVWLWEDGHDGNGYAFAEEDGEMVATMELTPGTTKVGFIVRTQDWEKDVDEDQFIDLSELVSGVAHVYVESGVSGYKMEYGENAQTGVKLKSAVYNEDGTLTVTMTGAIEGDEKTAFTVSGKEGPVEVTDVTVGSNNEYTLTLAEKLDETKSYVITYDGQENAVTMPIIYSTSEFEDANTYTGDDLGAVWTKDSTAFKVWAPTAEAVSLNLYESGNEEASDLIEQLPMEAGENGIWTVTKEGDLNGTYYTYTVKVDGEETEACDPYARTTGVNGKRAMVIDLDSTDPKDWDKDKNPHAGEGINDAIIYEAHVRDLTVDADAGIKNAGKFLGLTETGTKTKSGVATGVDHIKDLGVTHLHLLPIYDFGSVDESTEGGYNWGYDPVNYNVPEGSYSTDPEHGEVRVSELKQMVSSLHENGISVVMDVVYNHVYNAEEFCFNKIVPGYFSRISEDGTYSNGSGCGNDTASERTMVKKYIVDSVCYWADEYHMDGFRFDLVGLLDTETVNEIVEEVHKDHPDVIFYGEGWSLTTELTKEGYKLATQQSSKDTPDFAYFNDTIRDGLRGNVFNTGETGYVSGSKGKEVDIKRCFQGKAQWCKSPAQTINYASCHDNNTLYDRLKISRADAKEEDIIRMNNLAAAICLTSEGVPFMQAGEEMLRSKVTADGEYDSNSYSSGDEVNAIRWENLADEAYANVYEYYKGLIAFRKAHGVLRLSSAEDVKAAITPQDNPAENVVAFDIAGGVNGETAEEMYVVFNANSEAVDVTIPDGDWNVYINGEKAGTKVLDKVSGGKASVEPISALVLVRESGLSAGIVAGIVIASIVALALVAAGFVFAGKKKKLNKK